MVIVKYRDQLGNNLFQYCFGRILAENLGYELLADGFDYFPNTKKKIKGANYSKGYPEERLTGQVIDLEKVLNNRNKRKIVVDGHFQRFSYYNDYKELIRKKWLVFQESFTLDFEINSDDIIVCVRRGDYLKFGWALPMSYFEEALSKVKCRKIYICSTELDPFVRLLINRYRAIFLPYEDYDEKKIFRTIMSFNKVIISNSSFYWWAAFLSEAKEIIAPIPLSGVWSKNDLEVDLVTESEERFKFIECSNVYKESLAEKLIAIKRKLI